LYRVGEVARRHLARGALEPLDPLGQRARDKEAAEHRDRERDHARDEDPLPDQLDVGLHVGERAGEHGHAAHAPVAHERLGGDRLPPDVGLRRAGDDLARPHRLARHGLDLGERRRAGAGVRHRQHLRRVPRVHLEHGDLGAREPRGGVRAGLELVLHRLVPDGLAQRVAEPLRVDGEPLELLAHQLVLEPRGRVEVHDPDRRRHDQGEQERESVAERPQRPRHRHSSALSLKR
jgi:hypothetical protein